MCRSYTLNFGNNPGYSVRKLEYGPTNSVQNIGHSDFVYTNKNHIHLDATALSEFVRVENNRLYLVSFYFYFIFIFSLFSIV